MFASIGLVMSSPVFMWYLLLAFILFVFFRVLS